MTKTLLFQGVTQDNHLAIVRQLIQIPDPERIILSVGFMNEGGVVALEAALSPVAQHTTIITGIRNGITSAQGLRKCLELGCTTYVVDTGSHDVLFHPKVYVSRNISEARLMVGSANLTVGGLNSNIEASLFMEMDLAEAKNASLIEDIEAKIDGMIAEYPEHIFQVVDNAMIESLLVSGRVVDERTRPANTASGSSTNRDLDTVPRMNLHTWPITRHRSAPFPRELDDGAIPQLPEPAGVATPIHERLTLVWQSNPLTRRHLTIPTSEGTNPTGSMLFGKGAVDDIDQRHYFRDEVFANLIWQFDTAERTSHMERARARFQLIIRNVNYGVFTLRLSHNSRTDTSTYEQSNSMTQLHWEGAHDLIAREDLLDRTMYLYHDGVGDELFVLEID